MATTPAFCRIRRLALLSQRVQTTPRSYAFHSLKTAAAAARTSPSLSLSSSSAASAAAPRQLFRDAVVEIRGEKAYASSREYVLLPQHTTLEMIADYEGDDSLVIASLRAHRNIIFGAKVHETSPEITRHKQQHFTVADVCPPLVHAALVDAGWNGEQPQALGTLHGLCEWVQSHLLPLNNINVSDEAHNDTDEGIDDDKSDARKLVQSWTGVEREAVQAIATGIPRPGHSVVGVGTFRDGADAWQQAAKLFVAASSLSSLLSPECRLYQEAGGQLIQIEHLADTNPAYLESAGGAMARFVFFE